MAKSLALSAALLTATLANAPVAKANGDDKVQICHRPPGNPDNEHTITVGNAAVPAHLAHGDYVGACISGDGGNGGDPGLLEY